MKTSGRKYPGGMIGNVPKFNKANTDFVEESNAMTEHTPGPWKVMQGSLTFPKLLIRAPQTDKAIADCDYQQGAEGQANARLIAAAPDLIKALEAMLKAYNQLMPGIAHIAVQDYANINEAPILAKAALTAAGKAGS